MTKNIFAFPAPFTKSSKKPAIAVLFFNKDTLKSWAKKQPKIVQTQIEQGGFKGSAKQVLIVKDAKGVPEMILGGIGNPVHYLDSAAIVQHLQTRLSKDFTESHIFTLDSTHDTETLTKICLGWGLADYKFESYKKSTTPTIAMIWPKGAEVKTIEASINAICLIRNLINTPACDLGTDELASAAKHLATTHKAKIKITKGAELMKNFPMIHNVGKASPRPPQLVDMTWGNAKHPKVTLVGKGIVYDTGGLNIKTGAGMRYMKKDMGGAAHALATASMIMSLKLPVQLRVLLPIAENAIAGNAFRPGDILPTRKGLSVEIDDTDAEGRLVLADALTYACEEKPDLLVDFATLTGAARVAIGYDIPAFFTNNDKNNETLRHSSKKQDDFVWPFPLWEGYDANINGTISDIISVGSGRAGHIEAALFLQRFIEPSVEWIHMDCYAWEQNGKAGRPQGGADTGMRAIYNFIKARYS